MDLPSNTWDTVPFTSSRINIFDAHKPNIEIHYITIITQRDFRMSSLPKQMYKAEGTTDVGSYRLCLFNNYYKKNRPRRHDCGVRRGRRHKSPTH